MIIITIIKLLLQSSHPGQPLFDPQPYDANYHYTDQKSCLTVFMVCRVKSGSVIKEVLLSRGAASSSTCAHLREPFG